MGRLAMAILGDTADANDALQEALTSMWTGLPSLRDPARFGVWSDRIVVNACRLVLRRRVRSRVRQVSIGDVVGDRLESLEVPFDQRLADRLAVARAFDRLDADDRAVLALHHLDERSIAQIAAVLDIPAGTVKSRLHTARRALERAMERELR